MDSLPNLPDRHGNSSHTVAVVVKAMLATLATLALIWIGYQSIAAIQRRFDFYDSAMVLCHQLGGVWVPVDSPIIPIVEGKGHTRPKIYRGIDGKLHAYLGGDGEGFVGNQTYVNYDYAPNLFSDYGVDEHGT